MTYAVRQPVIISHSPACLFECLTFCSPAAFRLQKSVEMRRRGSSRETGGEEGRRCSPVSSGCCGSETCEQGMFLPSGVCMECMDHRSLLPEPPVSLSTHYPTSGCSIQSLPFHTSHQLITFSSSCSFS